MPETGYTAFIYLFFVYLTFWKCYFVVSLTHIYMDV